MKKQIALRIKPSETSDSNYLNQLIAAETGIAEGSVSGFTILKQSIDARNRQVYVNLIVEAYINEPYQHRQIQKIIFPDVSNSPGRVIIVGAGPAGLFSALRLIELGIKPILIERGKDVKSRRRDLAAINKQGVMNPESNYCFGEGGAGTYSDGKLYTRSSKRGDVGRILNLFVQFGADEKILYEAHPHIGTNKLPQIIMAIRKKILDCGGEIHFEKKLTGLNIENGKIKSIFTTDGDKLEANAVILATGHSARDIFHLLHNQNILVEFKPFALGVRIEHPQALIDSIQYHCPLTTTGMSPGRGNFLPPSSYSLVQQVNGKGVFSFCMCPGGIIAPAATNHGEIVVNGWSPSKRNNPFANSGIVVSVEEKDLLNYQNRGALAGLYFQQEAEQKAFEAGGGKLVAPAQRMADFCENKLSSDLPACSYLPGILSADLKNVLPGFIQERLQKAFKDFGNKMRGYYTNEAVIVATESRTSSPVRIPRHSSLMHHPQLVNLYPCGEGAGYAGGIVSAAMDGERTASVIAEKIKSRN
jgi:uncharacterized FAD-dependent dehydrogenase